MNLCIFMIYDSKAAAYLQPFFSQSQGTALRSFMDLANDPQHEFCKHAEDYTLFYMGTFDQAEGAFQLTVPEPLGNALALQTPGEAASGELRNLRQALEGGE